MFSLSDLSAMLLNVRGEVIWANEPALELFGFSAKEQLLGILWEDLIQINGKTVWDPSLDEQFSKDGFLKIDGYCDARERGRIAISLLMHPNGETDERLVVIHDITDVKAREEELEREKKNAEVLNNALEKEIEKANGLAVMAERANIAKSVFLTSMSHEFRTPLNGVLGYAQILDADKTLSDSNRKAVATIERSGQHLLSIINDVLDLSKIEAGKVEVAKEPLNLVTLVTDVMDVFRVRANAKGLELVTELKTGGEELEWILGDAKLIRQVLINLIGNAVKFTDHGGVTLRVELEHSDAHDPLNIDLSLSVIDTGPGIARKDLEKIFVEFFQTEAFSGHKGGTGLGLAISRKLAVAMGGKLHVESRVGKGSHFRIHLPTRKVEQRKENQSADNSLKSLAFAVRDIAYLQLFDDDLDAGVLKGLMQSMGLRKKYCYTATRSIDIDHELHQSWLVGVSAGGLLADNAQELIDWAKTVAGEVVVLLYVDRSQSKCQSFMEALRFLDPPVIPIEIPINLVSLKTTLYKQCGFLFETSQESSSSEAAALVDEIIGEASEEIPEANVLKAMLQEAQMGDMRRLNEKLEAWVSSGKTNTVFEGKIRQMVELFKIDQLCKYLESLL